MHPAIQIANLGKKYQLVKGASRSNYRTLRETIVETATAPLHWLRRAASQRPVSEDFWALSDVSFEVRPGEVVGIIGRNGAGKSTLLKILSRITAPTTGRVEVNGRVSSLLEVGTGFHPELTGRENVFLNGSILGMSRREIRERFDEIVAFAEVERFLDLPVKRYSSGMFVRLAFAVAAHLNPEILIVDEVLSVGDAAFQKRCLGKMKNVADSGRTVLFVSHNLTSLATFCQTGVLLDKGELVHRSAMMECIEHYTKKLMANGQKNTALLTDHEGNGFVQILVHSIGDSKAPTDNVLSYPGRYQLEFICGIPSDPDVNVGFTIVNQAEVPVISSTVRDCGLEPGVGRVSLSVELPVGRLPTGDYRIEGAVWSRRRMYAQSDGLFSFSVINQGSFLDIRGEKPRGGTLLDMPWQQRLDETRQR